MTAVGILILVVAAPVYAERMQISPGEPDLLDKRANGLRNQVDLGVVATDLRLVLDRTIQPVTRQIWLRSQP